MSDRPFVHLHCHSHYSLLDGAGSIDRLVERAQSHGMNALALTDHGNLHGALEFYTKAKKAGINPVVGYEAYVAPGCRTKKDSQSMKEATFHLTLLAQNRTGYKNLLKLASKAFLEGFYFKPRIDRELLAEYNEGLICLSGCASSEFSRAILKGHGAEAALAEAEEIAKWFHGIFGDRYFVEIQNNGVEVQRICMTGAVEIAQKLGLPMVATCDTHYVDRDDAEAQDIMLCVNTGKFRTDPNRMKMDGFYHLKSQDEVYSAFPDFPDAVARSQEIANSVSIDLELGKRHFPSFSIPPENTPEQFLRDLCVKGLKERYAGDEEMLPGGELAPVVTQRLERELYVINKLGFANYFLIVWDFVRYAREQGIPATARGSGVGAIVSYSTYLSHVCPIKYDLLFERFLDESRKEAPDIDIDFCQERRGDVIRYVKEKYGEANVAQIGTFGTLAARAAIKDVGRALGLPISRVTQITDMVPDELNIELKDAIEKSEELKQVYAGDAEIRELLNLALKVEGLARNIGTHAAAVVIADQPLTEYVPLGRVTGKTDVITQWAMNEVEAAGLLKMDFLGLRNLTILARAVTLIKQTTGQDVDPYRFPLDDKETFALLCRGETKGIFQLESGGIRDLLQRMKPDHFHDIIATNALYRPGPLEGGMVDDYVAVKHGRKPAEYKHPVMRDVLEETHGVMVYQEQVMRILNKLGGIELASAYTCIKAISKKKQETIDKFQTQFITGAVERGLGQNDAVELWSLIQKFAGYGFNKSHSTAYALVAYMTAYLKAHFPVEFMAALLSGDIDQRNFKRKDKLVEHMEDCTRMSIPVVPPNVNSSYADFAVSEGKIHFGLSAIKGCGGSAAEAVSAARERGGPFKSLYDFCERVDPQGCPKSAVETLIKAGALDAFGHRAQLTAGLERALQSGAAALADRKAGQKSLFGGGDEPADEKAANQNLPQMPPLSPKDQAMAEKEVLGFYLSTHPLAEHSGTLTAYASHSVEEALELPARAEVFLGGMLGSVKISHVKKAREPNSPTKFGSFDFEDATGAIRCNMWPEDFATYGHLVVADAILVLRGSIDRRGGGDEVNLTVKEIIPLDQLESRYTRGMEVRLLETEHGLDMVRKLQEVVRGYPGECEFKLLVCLDDGTRVSLRARQRVAVNPELRSRLETLLGAGNYRLLTAPPTPSKDTGFRRPQFAGARN